MSPWLPSCSAPAAVTCTTPPPATVPIRFWRPPAASTSAPSIPGYGFSGQPTELGWETFRTARAWAELMQRLGYTRYVAQGGDVGAVITDNLGRLAPAGLLGIHMNLLCTCRPLR